MEERKEFMEERKEEREKFMKARKAEQEKMEAKLKSILTEEQYNIYKSNEEQRRLQQQKRRANRPMMRGEGGGPAMRPRQ